MDLRCDLDNLPLLGPISRHKTRVTKTVNLSYLRFCVNIMHTVVPNNNSLLTEATDMDTNDCGMPNNSDFALFLDNGGIAGPHGDKMKNWRFYSYGNFEE